MSLAERLSSKFHICPRSFASRPNIHFSDNLSAADIISRHTSRLIGVYILNNLCTADLILSKPGCKLYQVTPSVRGFLLRGFGLWQWPLTASICMFLNQDVNSLLECKVAYMNLPIYEVCRLWRPRLSCIFPRKKTHV